MDRSITYTGELLSAQDVCYTNQLTMIGLAKLSEAVLGTNTLINNLACTPTSPASLSVNLGKGEIYSNQPLEATAYGPLPPDTTDIILKQGILLETMNFLITPPSTPGQSIDYLIQITYQDADTNLQSRQFFSGSPMNVEIIRRGELIASLKAGLPATTGSQVPPAPDAGYVGAWVVTIANGQSTVTSGDISVYSGAPFIPATLTQLLSQTQADARYAQLVQFSSSLTANGYINLPGNVILQWFNAGFPVTTGSTITTQSVTFPTPFSVGAFAVIGNVNTSAGATRGISVDVYSQTLTGAIVDFTASAAQPFASNATINLQFFAIGI